MSILDWIFAAVLMLSVLLGTWRGLVYEVLLLINWIVAFALAYWLAPLVVPILPMSGASEALRYAASFMPVFLIALLIGGLIAATLKRLTAVVGLRPIDRTLGTLFGVLRAALLLLLTTAAVHMTPFKNSSEWRQSNAAAAGKIMVTHLKPILPPLFSRFLPS